MKDGKLQVMDLFAGAGGLSNGFEQTNQFQVKIAVEINENARKTYLENHPYLNEELFHKDITKLVYKDEDSILKDEYQDIDVIIGGPPCQGFSNANRQKNTLISSNNQLVKEYLRAIEEIKPKAFIMENVRTLESEKHKFFISKDDEKELAELGLEPDGEIIKIGNVTNNFESLRCFLMNKYNNGDSLSKYIIDKDVFSKLNSLLRHAKNQTVSELKNFLNKQNNKKYFSKIVNSKWKGIHDKFWEESYKTSWNLLGENLKKILEDEEICVKEFSDILEEIIETQKVINKISEIIQNKIKLFTDIDISGDSFVIHIKSYNVFSYIKAKISSLGYKFNEENYIFNSAMFGVPQERRRLILIGVLEEIREGEPVKIPEAIFKNNKRKEYYKIHDAIKDLEKLLPSTDVKDDEIYRGDTKPLSDSPLNMYLNNNENNLIYNHVRTDSREIAQQRFEALTAGQNFHNLKDSLKTTYSDHSRTQNTIYKRLDYNEPSDTVLNVRKSMWIHPTIDRAISIREAARLQSFQDNYKFLGPKDSQYQQVGNAVPPLMARFVAESLLESLGIVVENKIIDIIQPAKKILN
ncbi:DNA cytosine methyltransferase [Neobacillus sp. PS2-9]|uniref:DNA cytosine methyltransferase n=1 Tax=Neobacillus sp. PS2-9 TaxID=3070676 RepID=UPI0027E12E2D|nr:DNA cytosine methyltransferase [Neobacillus sp. PS2-9]WML57758.1 DNA cytosine methyltransferase [Neobacillus sp. PS2-9]